MSAMSNFHQDREAEELLKTRIHIVRQYRARPQSWPDGIDSKHDRWYRPEEWNDAGECLGAPVNSDPVNTKSVNSTLLVNKPSRSDYDDPKAFMRAYQRWRRARLDEA